jgi:hypothetical protein
LARLPDASEIKPSIGMSGRPIATYDTTGYARGAAAMAQGAKDIGTGLTQAGNQVAAVVKQEKEKDDALDTAQAQAKLQVDKINYINSIKDDQDHGTLAARSQENLTAIGENAANMIRDPRRRELFKAGMADDLARAQAGVNDLAQKRTADAWGADLIGKLDGLRQGALLAETPEEKRKSIDVANTLIDAGAGKGFVSKEWAAKAKKQWVEDYTIAEFEKLPAEQRLMALRGGAPMQDAMKYFVGKGYEPHKAAGIVANLIAESGRNLNPNAVNKGDGRDGSDSIGIGQWNGPRAIALKQFAAAQGKPWNDLGVQLDFVDHELKGAEGKAGAMLNAARTPEEAARAMLHYERPKDYEKGHAYRLSSAKQVLGLFSKGGVFGSGRALPQSPKTAGLIEAGNIDLNARPVVRLPDGSIATVKSTSVNIDGQEVLIPTVSDDGRMLSEDEAIALYEKTGKHLGKFDTPSNATTYAKQLSSQQGRQYRTGLDLLPEDKRVKLERQAETQVLQEKTYEGVQRGEALEKQIIDAAAGQGDLPKRDEIENDPVLRPQQRNALLRQYDSAAGNVAAFASTWKKFSDPNGGSFNPYDADERKSVDTLYQHLGGNAPALQAVVDRTNILPKSAAIAMRGDFVSNDPKRVAQSLSVASNLLAKNQNIFVGVDGQKDFENNAVAFRHYVDDLGMTADDAAKKIVYQQSSEYQSGVKARLKGEDVDAKLKKDLSVSDISNSFDQSWLPFTDPKVGYTPESRLAMYGQYSEQVKERYLEHGDWGRAKKEAAATLGKSWGVTRVNGTPTVVPYAPERAPVMAGIENPADAIATGAISAIKDAAGYEPSRKSLQFIPVPGVTPAAYKAGQPVPYILKWEDANGNVQMSQKHFLIDGKDARAAQTGQRQTQFGKAAAGAAVNSEMRDVTPDPLRQYGFN